MNQFTKIALIATTCFTLSACMTAQQRYSQDYNSAEKNFASQNYHNAFKQVQAPAKGGDANAQYALGYMYYYGKGTIANRQLAHYWFQKAAKKGQANAKQALTMMHQQQQPSSEYSQQ